MRAGARRRELGATLRAAYGEGLLSESTFMYRADQLMATGSVSPQQLVGDLTLRPHRPLARIAQDVSHRVTMRLRGHRARGESPLLALDWHGSDEPLLIGRSDGCDLRLDDTTVSRRHARMFFRDGAWVVQDLGSKNGTWLNGRQVIRARVRPGDMIGFAERRFRVD
jgi:hypothetical protein